MVQVVGRDVGTPGGFEGVRDPRPENLGDPCKIGGKGGELLVVSSENSVSRVVAGF